MTSPVFTCTYTETQLEPSRTSTMELFAKNVLDTRNKEFEINISQMLKTKLSLRPFLKGLPHKGYLNADKY